MCKYCTVGYLNNTTHLCVRKTTVEEFMTVVVGVKVQKKGLVGGDNV